MARFLLTVLMSAILCSGCSTSGYDVLSTASIAQPRFKDTDPVDFGARHPHRHDIHGIDVSKWNGEIDWRAVKSSGISFAFIKATEGSDRLDSAFERNWKQAAAAGVPYAPYHFYYFCSTADAQADAFIRNVPKAAVKLPPVLDVEWNHASPTCKWRPDPATVRAEMRRFMDRIHRHYGKRPIIYTTIDFHRDNLVGHFEDHHFWVRSTAAHPGEIYPERRWAFWQYTATGVVPGINGNTDINVFAGTKKNWQAWVASAGK